MTSNNNQTLNHIQVSEVVSGNPLNIGAGFSAASFKQDKFSGLMDPVVMMDHYTMTTDTFGAHPHAGMSAVSVLFEDSEGLFNNQDSLGNDINLKPGDAYWLKAGSGAIHDEKPTNGSKIHGIQLFVNLPAQLKFDAPESQHVTSNHIPEITGENYRIRVVFGESNGVRGATSVALPFTFLDGSLNQGIYKHEVAGSQSVVVYAVSGQINLTVENQDLELKQGQSVAINSDSLSTLLTLASEENAHFVLLQGEPLKEKFVQKGPFVMSTEEDIGTARAAFDAGEFGTIS